MDDLVEWLRAQIDVDEASEWPHRPSCQMLKPAPAGFPGGSFSCNCDAADRWMARVLAEVDAKRRIIDSWEAGQDDNLPPLALIALDEVVKALALPFADRPGYQEEWRP